jgi:hypothetical protein
MDGLRFVIRPRPAPLGITDRPIQVMSGPFDTTSLENDGVNAPLKVGASPGKLDDIFVKVWLESFHRQRRRVKPNRGWHEREVVDSTSPPLTGQQPGQQTVFRWIFLLDVREDSNLRRCHEYSAS